ncbi:MAG: acyl-CoA desaturase [Proteobacteria bacterium]|nr:acyl-CoA desaturase [Pseudomonadota bacterium]
MNYLYAFFLVFITPLSVPLAVWTWWQGWVSGLDIALAIVMYCLSGLGITLGYHRLVTHRSFQAKPWLKRFLLVCGAFAMQGGPASWASLHIQHHRFADKPGDVHSPVQQGFWYSHCGWVFKDYRPNFRRYGSWLLKDKDVIHVSKHYIFYSMLGLIIPGLLLGWVGLLWAGFLRVFLCIHMTWFVNSVCHRWGKRRYNTMDDNSKNNLLVALFTFGEGWHNNHHRYLQMPFLGHRWYEIDIGKWVLLFFKKIGQVSDFKIPKPTN